MERDIKNQIYIYRKSFRFYYKLGMFILLLKCVLGISGVSAFVCSYLAPLSLGAPTIDLVTKKLDIEERKAEYHMAYKFYEECYNKYKAKSLNDTDFYQLAADFLKSQTYLPREKYMKELDS
jgi:hypothetical protein